ncbi:MAG: VanZ family protein [Bacteroidales bacterium]
MLTIPHIDKIVHLGMFLVFGTLLAYGFYLQENPWYARKYYGTITIMLGMVYGGLTELLQHYFLNMRSGTFFDFLANLFGTIFGVLIFVGIKSSWLKKYLNS